MNFPQLVALDWEDIDLVSGTIVVRGKYIPLRPNEIAILKEFQSFGHVFAGYADCVNTARNKFKALLLRSGYTGITMESLKEGYLRVLFRKGEMVTV